MKYKFLWIGITLLCLNVNSKEIESKNDQNNEESTVKLYKLDLKELGISDVNKDELLTLLSQNKDTEDFQKLKPAWVAENNVKIISEEDLFIQKRKDIGSVIIKGNENSNKNLKLGNDPPLTHIQIEMGTRERRKIKEIEDDLRNGKNNTNVIASLQKLKFSQSNSSNTDSTIIFGNDSRRISAQERAATDDVDINVSTTTADLRESIIKEVFLPKVDRLTRPTNANQFTSPTIEYTTNKSDFITGTEETDKVNRNEIVDEIIESSSMSNIHLKSESNNKTHDLLSITEVESESTVTNISDKLVTVGIHGSISVPKTSDRPSTGNTFITEDSEQLIIESTPVTDAHDKPSTGITFDVTSDATSTTNNGIANANRKNATLLEVKKEIVEGMGQLISSGIVVCCIGIIVFCCGIVLVYVRKNKKKERTKNKNTESYKNFDEV